MAKIITRYYPPSVFNSNTSMTKTVITKEQVDDKKQIITNLTINALQKHRSNFARSSQRLDKLFVAFNDKLKQKPFRGIKKVLSLWMNS